MNNHYYVLMTEVPIIIKAKGKTMLYTRERRFSKMFVTLPEAQRFVRDNSQSDKIHYKEYVQPLVFKEAYLSTDDDRCPWIFTN